jgi:AcrR family transcriptional regulator
MTRPYQLKRRAERQDQTRQRIVDAAIELHQTAGPTATTISDIAEHAGVGRVTVYRHFPDEADLLRACSGQYYTEHPFPDADRWADIADPQERLRTALRDAYAYHRATEQMHDHVLRDMAGEPVLDPYHRYWAHAADILTVGWGLRGRRKTLMRAAIALALSFETWRTLVRDHKLSDDQALDVALRLASNGS